MTTGASPSVPHRALLSGALAELSVFVVIDAGRAKIAAALG